jgi:hypothetical protein
LPTLLVTILYPPLETVIGTGAALPLLVAGILAFIFLAAYLPETQQVPIADVVKRWMKDDNDSEDGNESEVKSTLSTPSFVPGSSERSPLISAKVSNAKRLV